MRDGSMSHACYLLFAAGEPPVSTIELGRFQDDITIKDGARVKGDLFSEVEQVPAFIRKHINKRYIIDGHPRRREQWEYPLSALREVVTNAIVHRDYTAASDSVVKVFDDRIECYNPGRLPAGLTVHALLEGEYVSTPRNRQIADAFKTAGLIEKYGSGIRRILQAFREASAPQPRFREIGEGFLVTVYPVTPQKTPQKISIGRAWTRGFWVLCGKTRPRPGRGLRRPWGLRSRR
jgi:ATP-dependent DNA helicase RecG